MICAVQPLFLRLPLLETCCQKCYIQVLSRDHVPYIIGVFFISLYGFHQMMIFQALYTEKVQFENEPKLSKDNDQYSKHMLAK